MKSRKIDFATVNEFAKDNKYMSKSKTDFKRGRVNLHYDELYGEITFYASFCPLPWEFIATSPSKLTNLYLDANSEAKKWFSERGPELVEIPTSELIARNREGEQVVPSDGHKPSSHASSADPTAPADAH